MLSIKSNLSIYDVVQTAYAISCPDVDPLPKDDIHEILYRCSLEDDYSTEYLIGQIKGINVALHLKQVGQNLYLGVVQDTLYWAGHTTDQCAALIEQLCD